MKKGKDLPSFLLPEFRALGKRLTSSVEYAERHQDQLKNVSFCEAVELRDFGLDVVSAVAQRQKTAQ